MDINNLWQTFLNNNHELNTILDITNIDQSSNYIDINTNSNQNISNHIISNHIQQSGGSNELFSIINTQDKHCKQFNCTQLEYDIKFNNISKSFEQANNELDNLFDKLQKAFLSKMGNKDKI